VVCKDEELRNTKQKKLRSK